MKVIISGKHRAILRAPIIISAALVIVVCFSLFFYFGSDGDTTTAADLHQPVFAQNESAAAVSAVLGTLEHFGARDIDQALTVWAEGVASRNGISQYSVMSEGLKEKYLNVAGDTGLLFPTSSTRVDGWYVSEIIENEDGTSTAQLRFNIDNGSSSIATAELTLGSEGDFCVVSAVAVESALYEFTGIG